MRKEESIPVGSVPTVALASTPGGIPYPDGYTLAHGYTLPPERIWYQDTLPPPPGEQIDIHLWKHYLPANSLVVGKKSNGPETKPFDIVVHNRKQIAHYY